MGQQIKKDSKNARGQIITAETGRFLTVTLNADVSLCLFKHHAMKTYSYGTP
jgi:hypothetical protein